MLAACSLGGAGHFGPLLPLLDAARSRGDETLVIAPRSLASLVQATGHRLATGGEPADAEIAELRGQLAVADAASATGRAIEPGQVRTDASNVVVRQWVDQTDAMAGASAVVCHGGSGTTLGADDDALIRHAAAQLGQSVSEFLTTAAKARAHEVLADQCDFVIDEAAWVEFTRALDAPPRPDPKLVELFARPQRIQR